MISLSGVAESWWGAGGIFSLARTPTHSPPDVKTGRGALRSLCTLPPVGTPSSCLLRVWLFAMGEEITRLGFLHHRQPAVFDRSAVGFLPSTLDASEMQMFHSG